jgi:hypothetical protein
MLDVHRLGENVARSTSDYNYARAIAEAMVEYGGALNSEGSMVLAKVFLQQKAETLRLVRCTEQLQEHAITSLAALKADCAHLAGGGASYAETLALAIKMIREISELTETFNSMSAVLDEWPRPLSHEPEATSAKGGRSHQ